MKTETELRELDAWIGVNLFGKKAISKYGLTPTLEVEEDCFVKEWIHISESLPRYSTDPTAAMLVLEKCAGETTTTIRKQGNGSFCVWWTESENMKENYIMGETLPLAICLFAKELFKK